MHYGMRFTPDAFFDVTHQIYVILRPTPKRHLICALLVAEVFSAADHFFVQNNAIKYYLLLS